MLKKVKMTRNVSDITVEKMDISCITARKIDPSQIDPKKIMPVTGAQISDDTINRRQINWFRLLIKYIKRWVGKI